MKHPPSEHLQTGGPVCHPINLMVRHCRYGSHEMHVRAIFIHLGGEQFELHEWNGRRSGVVVRLSRQRLLNGLSVLWTYRLRKHLLITSIGLVLHVLEGKEQFEDAAALLQHARAHTARRKDTSELRSHTPRFQGGRRERLYSSPHQSDHWSQFGLLPTRTALSPQNREWT